MDVWTKLCVGVASVMGSLEGGRLIVCVNEGFVNLPDIWCFDKSEYGLKCTVIVAVVHKFRPVK